MRTRRLYKDDPALLTTQAPEYKKLREHGWVNATFQKAKTKEGLMNTFLRDAKGGLLIEGDQFIVPPITSKPIPTLDEIDKNENREFEQFIKATLFQGSQDAFNKNYKPLVSHFDQFTYATPWKAITSVLENQSIFITAESFNNFRYDEDGTVHFDTVYLCKTWQNPLEDLEKKSHDIAKIPLVGTVSMHQTFQPKTGFTVEWVEYSNSLLETIALQRNPTTKITNVDRHDALNEEIQRLEEAIANAEDPNLRRTATTILALINDEANPENVKTQPILSNILVLTRQLLEGKDIFLIPFEQVRRITRPEEDVDHPHIYDLAHTIENPALREALHEGMQNFQYEVEKQIFRNRVYKILESNDAINDALKGRGSVKTRSTHQPLTMQYLESTGIIDATGSLVESVYREHDVELDIGRSRGAMKELNPTDITSFSDRDVLIFDAAVWCVDNEMRQLTRSNTKLTQLSIMMSTTDSPTERLRLEAVLRKTLDDMKNLQKEALGDYLPQIKTRLSNRPIPTPVESIAPEASSRPKLALTLGSALLTGLVGLVVGLFLAGPIGAAIGFVGGFTLGALGGGIGSSAGEKLNQKAQQASEKKQPVTRGSGKTVDRKGKDFTLGTRAKATKHLANKDKGKGKVQSESVIEVQSGTPPTSPRSEITGRSQSAHGSPQASGAGPALPPNGPTTTRRRSGT